MGRLSWDQLHSIGLTIGWSSTSSWRDAALCAQVDPDRWFPDKGGATNAAIRVCKRCPVQAECLQYALDNDERYGVWGGVGERDRRRMKRTIKPIS